MPSCIHLGQASLEDNSLAHPGEAQAEEAIVDWLIDEWVRQRANPNEGQRGVVNLVVCRMYVCM